MIPKIRAWDKHVKKIRKVTEIHFDDSLIYLKANNGKGYYCSFSDIELMQSTGLKDKNGVEIFEGDIANITDYKNGNEFRGVISFKNGSYVVESNIATHYRFIDYDIEIIGDIYQNPELLEGE